MSVLVCQFQGRYGNQCLQYLFARGFAERHGMELQTPEWVGERVFQLSHPRPDPAHVLSRKNETELTTLASGAWSVEFRGYAQMQECADYYSKRQAQSWLKLNPSVELLCKEARPIDDPVICHMRRSDYFGYGYPVVAKTSYWRAIRDYGFADAVQFLSDNFPGPSGNLPDDLSFMSDFYRMMKAPTLLRGNSSFSWLAALLGNGLVLSPVIDGLEGGKEHHDVPFVAGNHPRFCNLDFVTDLYVAP